MTEEQLEKKKTRELAIGQKIAEYIIKTGKTQREVAKDLEIALSSVVYPLKVFKNHNPEIIPVLEEISKKNIHKHKNTITSSEKKKEIALYILKNQASYRQTAKEYNCHQVSIANWMDDVVEEKLLEEKQIEQLIKLKGLHTTRKGKKR